MKKMIVSFFMVGIVLSATATQIKAAEVLLNEKINQFMDLNGDGICDYYRERHHHLGFIDEDGDGVCDNMNHRFYFNDVDKDGICDTCNSKNYGNFFIDSNKDGVCDNYHQNASNRVHHKGFSKKHRH